MTLPKPCPFCGHTEIEFCDSRRRSPLLGTLWGKLECQRCFANVETYKKDSADIEWHERAVATWNNRAYEHPQNQLEAVKGSGSD